MYLNVYFFLIVVFETFVAGLVRETLVFAYPFHFLNLKTSTECQDRCKDITQVLPSFLRSTET